MYILKAFSLFLGITLIINSPLVAQDSIIIESESTSANGSKTATTLYISDNNLLIKNNGQDNSSFLFDSSNELFTFIDNRKKEYYELDKATLATLKDQLSMLVMMLKQFSSEMPPEQKKKLEPILNPKSQPTIEYSKTGSEKIASWNTSQYSGSANGEEIMNINIASYDAIGHSKSSFAVLEAMKDFTIQNLKDLLPLLPYQGSTALIGLDDNSPILKDGIPIRTFSYENDKLINESLVKSITKKTILSSQFDIPSGYQKKKIDLKSQLGQ